MILGEARHYGQDVVARDVLTDAGTLTIYLKERKREWPRRHLCVFVYTPRGRFLFRRGIFWINEEGTSEDDLVKGLAREMVKHPERYEED